MITLLGVLTQTGGLCLKFNLLFGFWFYIKLLKVSKLLFLLPKCEEILTLLKRLSYIYYAVIFTLSFFHICKIIPLKLTACEQRVGKMPLPPIVGVIFLTLALYFVLYLSVCFSTCQPLALFIWPNFGALAGLPLWQKLYSEIDNISFWISGYPKARSAGAF